MTSNIYIYAGGHAQLKGINSKNQLSAIYKLDRKGNKLCTIRKTLKGRKQTKMEGGQGGTYLRLTRASSGRRVSVAKTYRDETKRK